MTKSVRYTGTKVSDMNGEIYIQTDQDGSFELGIATPPPERPGDNPMMISLVRFAKNVHGKFTIERGALPRGRLRILQKIAQSQGVGGAATILDIREEDLLEKYQDLRSKLEATKSNVFEKVVNLMALAESVGVRYGIEPNEVNPNSLVFRVGFKRGDEFCPITEENVWQMNDIEIELQTIAQTRNLRQRALDKLTPEERQALGVL